MSKKGDVLLTARFAHRVRPDAAGNFADMGTAEEEHAETGLADTATHGLGQFAGQELAVEVEFEAFLQLADLELLTEHFGVDADAHGGDFEGSFEDGVPDEDIAVESTSAGRVGCRPVVVVGSPAVVDCSVGQLAADAGDEDSLVFGADEVLTLLHVDIGPTLLEFFGCDEEDVLWQDGADMGVDGGDVELGSADAIVDRADDVVQGFQVSLVGGDDLLPVPLVDVNRVEFVDDFIGPNGVHVGVKSFADVEAVFGQCESFPFGEGLDDLDLGVAVILDGESNGLFDAVEIVVDAQSTSDGDGGGDAYESEGSGKLAFEEIFDILDGCFALAGVEGGLIGCRQVEHGKLRELSGVGGDRNVGVGENVVDGGGRFKWESMGGNQRCRGTWVCRRSFLGFFPLVSFAACSTLTGIRGHSVFSQARGAVMKKTLILVGFLVVSIGGSVRFEVVAGEAVGKANEAESVAEEGSAEVAVAVGKIWELAKLTPVPFEKIEEVAAQAKGTVGAGRICAVVATVFHEHGNVEREVHWAKAALRCSLAPVDRLLMFRYWIEATEKADGASVLPALLGLAEAGNFRMRVEESWTNELEVPLDSLDVEFAKLFESVEESDDKAPSGAELAEATRLLEPVPEMDDPKDELIHAVASDDPKLRKALEDFLCTKGLVEGTSTSLATPGWLAKGRAIACTFRVDYPRFWKDLPPVMDRMIGYEDGIFLDVLESLRADELGPHVDYDQELIPYLGEETTLVFDYRDPISGRGERLLLAIKVVDAKQVCAFLDKFYSIDDKIQIVTEAGEKMWMLEVPVFGGGVVKRAYCVARGYLFCADVDLLVETLKRFE